MAGGRHFTLPRNPSFPEFQIFSSPPSPTASNAAVRFRSRFGVRSPKPFEDLPLALFGPPTDPGQVRRGFGFGEIGKSGKGKSVEILRVAPGKAAGDQS